jgi:hypothetical protein
MTTSDKRKTAFLVLLVAIGVAAYIWMYGSNTVASNSATEAKKEVKATSIKPGQGAQILLDLAKDVASDEVGRKNLFQYRQKAAPPKPVQATLPIAIPQNPVPPGPVAPPPPPPPPPFKAFRYEGFSVAKGGGKLLGSVTESGTTYTVTEGECLMGQFCISKLTENLVEIEDLQLKRKQTFTRTQ